MIAKIFVRLDDTLDDLVAGLGGDMIGRFPSGFLSIAHLRCTVQRNPDRNLWMADPEGFLYFPFTVEVVNDLAPQADCVGPLRLLLNALVELGATYVVASDLEEALGQESRNDVP
ncbi:MAG: hypothetical protein AAGC53_14275 [Actinomycetota bacterium]